MNLQGKTYLPISRRTALRLASHSYPIFLYHHGHGYFAENLNDFLGAEAQILAVAGKVGYWREVECEEVVEVQVNELND